MDIPFNVKVSCTDGPCGYTRYVIMNPHTEAITHLVVENNSLFNQQHLVPIDLIVESTPQHIRLRCSKNDLAQMDPFIETEVIPGYPPSDSLGAPPLILKHQMVPPGELAIRRGARVEATDGPIGHVDEFLIDPVSNQITHLVLRAGYLWSQTDQTVPVDQIDHIEEDTVYLKLSKIDLEKLPKKSTHT
jgi:uncharacterized protein YrrD